MPNDPKWRTISRVSGQTIATVQTIYLHLLVDASRNVTRGHVTVTNEDLASSIDVTDDAISAVLEAMQGRVLDGDRLTGWELRQPKREDAGNPESGAKSATERKREQRKRDNDKSLNNDGHELSRNVTTDKDKDKDKEEIKALSILPIDPANSDSVKTKCPKEKNPAVLEIFNYWKSITNHKAAKLDVKREKVIGDALKIGYSVDELRAAILGCSKTPFNCGDNDRQTRFDGLGIIFKNADQIDRFIQNSIQPVPAKQGLPAGEKKYKVLN